MKFKVIFPGGYGVANIYKDNLDINIILGNGNVFFSTFFTLQNIEDLMLKDNVLYFWATDMVVIKDLKKETIREAITKIINDGFLDVTFSEIGTVQKNYDKSFDQVMDMTL